MMKFGGAIMRDADDILKVAEIVKGYRSKGDEVAVVVSALGGTTDSLVEIMKNIAYAKKARMEKMLDSIASRHLGVTKRIEDPKLAEETEGTVNRLMDDFRNVALGISHIGELTPRSRDFLLSFGERLSAPIVTAFMKQRGVEAKALSGGEAGIMTDDCFGEAEPLINVTNMQLKQNLEPLLKEGITPVITGFIASTQSGVTTTLGRGGSDLTAAVVGHALEADELWFWKDVPGMMTADPLLFSGARVIEKIAFKEAIEMAHFGAMVIHPKALEQGINNELVYRIRNIDDPDGRGTLIVRADDPDDAKKGAVIRGISVIDKVYLINISGARLVGTPRVVARVLELLSNEEVDVLMISQSSSEANVSIAIPEADSGDAMNILELSLLGTSLVREITGEGNYCIVAVVGKGMKGTPGVAANVFKSMADRKINIRTIAQGSSELNISFMISRDDAKVAVEALHRDFRLDEA